MRSFHTLLLSFLMVHALLCRGEDEDTLKLYRLGEMLVTATRSRIALKDAPSHVMIYGRPDLSRLNGTNIADVLTNGSSLNVSDYGGNSGLKTVSVRGASSQQLLVLVNGQRYNSFQHGAAYLNHLHIAEIEQIEVVHGGNSALYGADALGGVINILTRQAKYPFSAKCEGSVGSFGYRSYFAEAQSRQEWGSILTGLTSDAGRDNFPFQTAGVSHPETTQQRRNADFRHRRVFINASFNPDGASAIDLASRYSKSEFGVPGPISFPSGNARQSNEDIYVSAGFRDTHFGYLDAQIRSGFHYDYMIYDDPDSWYPSSFLYKNIYASLNPQITFKVTDNQKIIAGCDIGRGVLTGNEFKSDITRVQHAVYVSGESVFGYDREYLDRFLFFQTIRYDKISDIGYAVTPKLGMNLRIMRQGDLRFRMSFGENFRSPTFNDLYYPNFSNPYLKPEHSVSFDAGFATDMDYLGGHSMDITYFHNSTANRIVLNGATYKPENVGRAVSDGIEIKYGGKYLHGLIDISVNYSHTDARKKNRDYLNDSTYDKQLKMVPKNVLNITSGIRLAVLSVNLTGTVVGKRFVSMDNLTSLPEYFIAGGNINMSGPVAGVVSSLRIEVNNIFDRSYKTVNDYPMTGRSYRITVGIEYR